MTAYLDVVAMLAEGTRRGDIRWGLRSWNKNTGRGAYSVQCNYGPCWFLFYLREADPEGKPPLNEDALSVQISGFHSMDGEFVRIEGSTGLSKRGEDVRPLAQAVREQVHSRKVKRLTKEDGLKLVMDCLTSYSESKTPPPVWKAYPS